MLTRLPTCALLQVTKEQLVDTNGAGDAYVGGFLSQIAVGKVSGMVPSSDNCFVTSAH